jgi:hypothetical protein
MALTLQDPELMADCQRFIARASAVAQSSMHLYEFALRGVDKSSPEYNELKEYQLKHLSALKEDILKLEQDLV